DFDALKDNPKIFTGYSDTTANHFMFYNNGISTSYGPALLTDFAENIEMDDYTIDSIRTTWFKSDTIGEVKPSEIIRRFGLKWDENIRDIERESFPNPGYESIIGRGLVRGHLFGGCFELFGGMRGTGLFSNTAAVENGISFLETSEAHITADCYEEYLRAF